MITTQTFRMKEIYDDEDSFNSEMYGRISTFYPQINQGDCRLATDLIYLRYANSEVAYDTPEAFKRNLCIKVVDFVPQFVARLQRLREINALTLDDLIDGGTTIMNSVDNSNDKVADPLNTVLEYIGTQDSTKSTQNKFDSLQEAIDRTKALYTERYLGYFSPLFIKVYGSTSYDSYLYKKED